MSNHGDPRACRLAPKPSEAEVAFLVIDEYQHQGLATRLLKQLLRTGYVRGIDTFTADTLLTNFGMQALVTHHVDGVKAIRDGTEVCLYSDERTAAQTHSRTPCQC
jgi:GNAT superfamily N-acetyltransferase